jgi:UDP-N-acetylglucosamine 2-epimerase (non-hydrolysing)
MTEAKHRILLVVGARPNFVKMAPIIEELKKRRSEFDYEMLHTGQHFDDKMAGSFFSDLQIPRPDINLNIAGGTRCSQLARMLNALDILLAQNDYSAIVVVGDVTSTLAGAISGNTHNTPIVHVEAGLRSFDRTMPEEVNRKLVDQLSDLLLTSSPECEENLVKEGIASHRIRFVGNVMIDSLHRFLPKAKTLWPTVKSSLQLSNFALVTLHRPSNVDNPSQLREIMRTLEVMALTIPVLFPVHPRTASKLSVLNCEPRSNSILLTDPLSYVEFLSLQLHAEIVLTDSGGVQEETTVLGTRCLTLRSNTERPITITEGTNELVEPSHEAILEAVKRRLESPNAPKASPRFWDGAAAVRIVDEISQFLDSAS